jgi:Mor family transcriptional regulator
MDVMNFLDSLERYGGAESLRLLSLHAPGLREEERRRVAGLLGRGLREYISLTYGGAQVYIGQPTDLRSARIYQEFDGGNYAELALKYRLSERHVRNIVNQELSARRLRQGSLLELE